MAKRVFRRPEAETGLPAEGSGRVAQDPDRGAACRRARERRPTGVKSAWGHFSFAQPRTEPKTGENTPNFSSRAPVSQRSIPLSWAPSHPCEARRACTPFCANTVILRMSRFPKAALAARPQSGVMVGSLPGRGGWQHCADQCIFANKSSNTPRDREQSYAIIFPRPGKHCRPSGL